MLQSLCIIQASRNLLDDDWWALYVSRLWRTIHSSGRDVIVQESGEAKMASVCISVLQCIDEKHTGIQAIVLTRNRDVAAQASLSIFL